MSRTTVLAMLAGLTLATSLAGCTGQTPEDEAADWVGPTNAVITPKPPTPAHGEALTTQEQIGAAEAAGMAAYELPDGTTVALDPAQPLPPALYADVFARLADQLTDPWGLRGLGDTAWLSAALREVSRDAGKHIVLVHASWGYPATLGYDINNAPYPDDPPYVTWGISGDTNLMPTELQIVTDDQAAKLAEVQAWVDAQPASEHWELLVAPAPTVPRPPWGCPLPDGTIPTIDPNLSAP